MKSVRRGYTLALDYFVTCGKLKALHTKKLQRIFTATDLTSLFSPSLILVCSSHWYLHSVACV